jgi:hypothetical protein
MEIDQIISLLLEKKDKDLQKYLSKENPIPDVAQKIVDEYNMLAEINNQLSDLTIGLPLFSLKDISKKVNEMDNLDPELDGHTLFLHRKKGYNLCQIHIDI